ncbi:MAG: T9SS type A sorting domain-containing protein [Hyphomicrobiales bacterium]
MKKNFILLLLSIVTFSFNQVFAQNLVEDQITLGSGYENDVYYSMKDGVVATVPRTNWDIAFKTTHIDATIITNGGAGIELYTYPNGDISSWATVDTAGLYQWKKQYNTPAIWENGGAFNVNATQNMFDFGWGVYNPVSHDVVGDSLFIIKLQDGSYKKLRVDKKESIKDIYHFTYANLDGTDEKGKTLDLSTYSEKLFLYYSLSENQELDREPQDKWDFVFTKYIGIVPDQDNNLSYYALTGALLNEKREANKFTEVDQNTFVKWYNKPLEKITDRIGADWKYFDMTEMTYVVFDDIVYFVKDINGDIYKLFFTDFEGTSTGIIKLKKGLASPVGVEDISKIDHISIFPNPATDFISVKWENKRGVEMKLSLVSMDGRTISKVELPSSMNQKNIDLSDIDSGVYMLILEEGNKKYTEKILVK